jgi:hypothetical protein
VIGWLPTTSRNGGYAVKPLHVSMNPEYMYNWSHVGGGTIMAKKETFWSSTYAELCIFIHGTELKLSVSRLCLHPCYSLGTRPRQTWWERERENFFHRRHPIVLQNWETITNIFVFSQTQQYFVVCFLLGNSLVSEFYMLTFRNTLSIPSS